MSRPGFAVVLPVRYASTRFPGKPLASISGRPLIQWVVEAAGRIRGADRVIVATDSRRIFEAVQEFGGEAVITSGEHRTGTDRVAEIARQLDVDIIVNLQGDEPVVPEGLVEAMVSELARSDATDIVTACHPIAGRQDLENPNYVKVVMDSAGRALYFSRSPIPCPFGRDGETAQAYPSYRHIGIYVFRREALIRFASIAPSPLELCEGLEQLRALEHGMKIRVVISAKTTVGVDVPEDIKIVEKVLAGNYTGAFGNTNASNRGKSRES
ncbi:MAG: 3-deoxy-manno-octulosonate cytidylyltransferase [Candidatus Latescibacterota bacterium]